jgi:ubiquinone/menaquinone biosynthesis C-methylase UbiE
MGSHGGFSLDEATRRSWYNPEDVLKDLRSGMTFADIGCGDGYFTLLAAKKVGETGKVYAVDIDPQGIEKLTNTAKTQRLNNIIATAGRAEDTVFCKGCVDIVFYSMDLHDFHNPVKVLQNARQMVKSNGQLLDLDWKKVEMPFGPPFAIRFSEEKASDLIRSAGFSVTDVKDVGPYHYVVTAKPV